MLLSCHIQKFNFTKPFSLLPPKPSLSSHGETSPSKTNYNKKQKSFLRKNTNLRVRASVIDRDPLEATKNINTEFVTIVIAKVKIAGVSLARDINGKTQPALANHVGNAIDNIVTTPPLDNIGDIVTTHLAKTGTTVDNVVTTTQPLHDTVSLLLELVSADLDGRTGQEKDTVKAYVNFNPLIPFAEAKFKVPSGFGEVGAIRIQNEYHKEVYMESIVLDGFSYGPVTFSCKSWIQSIQDDPKKRIFFTDKSYLPADTPKGLEKLRDEELKNLRGNGQGERKKFERIYDYDTYNDLGDPDTNLKLKRPVLGSKDYPYPRRCRTGRPRTETDPLSESRSSDVYVPRDESFSELKQESFNFNTLKSMVHGWLPRKEAELFYGDNAFPSFTAIDKLFNQEIELPQDKSKFLNIAKAIADKILLFESPKLFEQDQFSWFRDEEFARQTLAGLNPLSIQLVTKWPLKSQLDPKIYGRPESSITKEIVEKEIKGSMTVEEAVKQKRLFILDYHDILLPYVAKVRELEGTTLYGSRTIFFLDDDGSTLRPVAIELTRPPIGGKPEWKRVYTPTDDATGWLWRLAKTHVLAHDSGIHQLVSHWVRTHCCVEPYVIAANRQLSQMHPIYRLLHPYFRYTMEMNALARQKLINAGGIIEGTFSPGKYSIELSSVAYDKLWRFDTEALPADLIKRGMAEEDPTAKHGLKLTIKDYPYANDGLILWDAIKEWVTAYVNHYYPEESNVKSDNELQSWWEEVKTKGHEDKKDEPWWPVLKTQKDLIQVLTTIIWVTSGHHAAVNFGQYLFSGYFPNQPTIARTNMPDENLKPHEESKEYQNFLKKPIVSLLKCFPSQQQATQVMAILYVLSSHSPDEEYIGQTWEPSWKADPVIKIAYEKFQAKLMDLEATIDEKNNDLKNTNRAGVGIVPYELLKPKSESGVTGMGVPNSISI